MAASWIAGGQYRLGRLGCLSCLVIAGITACGNPRSDPSSNPPAPPAQVATAGPKSQAAARETSDGYSGEALGSLHFDISGGTPEARQRFFHGLLALHSFWYDEAIRQFEAAIAADPTFSMAYWGLAMSHARLLWGDDDVAAGREALTRMPAANLLPPHDQAWVVAALALFRRARADILTTRKDFLAVMEQVHTQFPDDESALFLALALLSTIRPGDPGEVALRRRAGALANGVLQHNPEHPGAAHYLIHAFDTPELAELALPAAQQYATIAPAAFHALHMPAHIFVRLGMWKPALASCQAAWDASVAAARRAGVSAGVLIDHQDFHSLSWIIELSFERGRRADAERALAVYAGAVRAGLSHEKRTAYANQVASFLGRTGEWHRIDDLLSPLASPAAPDTAAASSLACGHHASGNASPASLLEQRAVLSARAQAAAMRRDRALLERLLDQRDTVDAELRPFLVATQPRELVETTDRLRGPIRAALVARARGDDAALVAALRPLALDQEQEFTGEGVAGGMLHHEAMADALLRMGKTEQALAEYQLVLSRHTGRARALLGAARATAKLGDASGARELYRKLLEVWAEADQTTDGLVEARRAVSVSR